MKPRILVVEDHLNTRMALAYQLQLAGYEVVEAENGETAIERLHTETFALVLTDIVIGRVSGIDVLHAARMQPYHPAVILLTGHASIDSAIASVNEGATAYLLKPCSTAELLSWIEHAIRHQMAEQQLREAVSILTGQTSEVLSQSEQRLPGTSTALTSGETVQIGALLLGSVRQSVVFRGHPVHLTPIEYALLRCLAQNPGAAYSYSAIVRITHRLELSEDEAQALLRPHVRNLRKKLDANIILTERGTGYLLGITE